MQSLRACGILVILLSVVVMDATSCLAIEPQHPGVEFARVEDQPLLLDLYLPEQTQGPVPVIVWVHGGAWSRGSRNDVPIKSLCKQGFAIASVDYRLSTVARFPAQVHDIKAAVRFLRAHAADYQLDPHRIFIAGASAGGHLAMLVAVTNGHARLEGKVGEHRATSSDVQGGLSWYGASNLESILEQSPPLGLNVRIPALKLLLGGLPEEQPELARLASPAHHLNQFDPPLWAIHGDGDTQMPVEQSHELKRVSDWVHHYRMELEIIPAGGHGGPEFYTDEIMLQVAKFLKETGARIRK